MRIDRRHFELVGAAAGGITAGTGFGLLTWPAPVAWIGLLILALGLVQFVAGLTAVAYAWYDPTRIGR